MMTAALWGDLLWRDLRHAVRRLIANPALTLVATASLGLGIGANTAAFGVLHAVLLRSLPVRDPGSLVLMATQAGSSLQRSLSYPLYADLRDQSQPLAEVIAFRDLLVNVHAGGATEQAGATLVSGNYFGVLGVPMALGTAIGPEDDRAAGSGGPRGPAVVLSHAYWQRRFAGDPAIAGRGLRVNGQAMTVIGVAPSSFQGTRVGSQPDLYLSMSAAPALFGVANRLENPRDNWIRLMARLAPGVTPAQAQAAMTQAFRRFSDTRVVPLVTTDQARQRARTAVIALSPGGAGLAELTADLRPALLALMGLVAIVLLLACVNVANLLVARAERHHRDTAIHLALGASGARLFMQSLAEGLLLGAAGLAAGLVLAVWMRGLLLRLAPEGVRLDVSMSMTVFGAASLLALAASLFVSIAAGWQRARQTVLRALKGEDAHARQWLRQGLMVGQLALSIVVVVAAALFGQTLRNVQQVDPGFARDRVLLASVDAGAYPPARQHAFYARLLADMRATPGVQAAALANDEPLTVSTGWTMRVRSARTGAVESPTVPVMFVTSDYFRTMGIPFVAGRDHAAENGAVNGSVNGALNGVPKSALNGVRAAGATAGAIAGAGATRPVIVNETFVAQYVDAAAGAAASLASAASTESATSTASATSAASAASRAAAAAGAIGFRMTSPNSDEPFEVVGVVRDSAANGLRDAIEPLMYLQAGEQRFGGRLVLHVRAAMSPAALQAAMAAIARHGDPEVTLFDVRSIEQHLSRVTGRERTFAQLSSVFGLLALMLSAVGLYGIIAYAVSRRTKELGIRLALGSSRAGIIRLVLREAIGLLVLGTLLGVPLAFALGGAVRSLLFGVQPGDWRSLAAAVAVLALVALASALVPARRAARVDPLIALRYD